MCPKIVRGNRRDAQDPWRPVRRAKEERSDFEERQSARRGNVFDPLLLADSNGLRENPNRFRTRREPRRGARSRASPALAPFRERRRLHPAQKNESPGERVRLPDREKIREWPTPARCRFPRRRGRDVSGIFQTMGEIRFRGALPCRRRSAARLRMEEWQTANRTEPEAADS